MTKRPKLRTRENADHICALLSEGHTLRQAARQLGFQENASLILNWVRDDPAFRDQYTRAREAGCLLWADQLLAISDADYTGPGGLVDHARVQQARLMSDNRKWLLARMLPKQFGDRVVQEITGQDGGAFISKIELIPISPRRLEADVEAASAGEAAATPLRAIISR